MSKNVRVANENNVSGTSSSVSPVVRRRLAEMLDALSAECEALAHDEDPSPASYERVLHDIETLAETLRESASSQGEGSTEWTLGDRAKDAAVAKTIDRASGRHPRAERVVREGALGSEESGWCRTLTREDAQRVIDALREQDAVLHDVQRAIG